MVNWVEKVISRGPSEELNSISIEFEFPNQVELYIIYNLKIAFEAMSGMNKNVVLEKVYYIDSSNRHIFIGIDGISFSALSEWLYGETTRGEVRKQNEFFNLIWEFQSIGN